MIKSIQVLRGISILLVVIYHATAINENAKDQYYFEFGKIGVDIFFIISGYIMALICERNEPVTSFIKKRAIRIMPLYVCVTLLAAVANYRSDLLSGSGQVWASLIESLFMIPHYSIANENKIFPIFIPGWTITYEVWFYAAIALVGILFKFKNKILIVPYLLSCIYIFSEFLPDGPIEGFLGNSVFLAFALGMLIRFHESAKITLKVLIASIIFFYLLAFMIEKESARFVVLGFPAFCIFLFFFVCVGDRLNVFAYIGRISYSLYLTHVFTINLVEFSMRNLYWKIPFGLELMMIVAFLASILVAAVSYGMFERKLDMMLRKRFL